MMVNCPKCNFLQEKDTYCANCGINMETWKPPKVPLIKQLLSNWIIQLSLLFVVVLALVLFDSFSEKKEIPEVESYATNLDDSQEAELAPEETEPESLSETSKVEKVIGVRGASKQVKLSKSLLKETSSQQDKQNLKEAISLSAHLINQSELEDLMGLSQKEDDNIGHLPRETFEVRLKQADPRQWQHTYSTQKKHSLNKVSTLFLGESVEDSKLGFFAEATILDASDLQKINMEVKIWSDLKTQREPEPALSFEITIPQNHVILISGFIPKDLNFSEEERSLFESSNALRLLNHENFIEEYSDITLVLELISL